MVGGCLFDRQIAFTAWMIFFVKAQSFAPINQWSSLNSPKPNEYVPQADRLPLASTHKSLAAYEIYFPSFLGIGYMPAVAT